MKTIIKAFVGLIIVAIVGIGVLVILPELGIDNPVTEAVNDAKNAAANAALDASGIKEKAQAALEGNAERIAAATGMSTAQVNEAIANLDIESWRATTLPADALPAGTSNISYGGTDATITTYDDPSVVTVNAYGQNLTLEVPASAQQYLGYLEYL